VPVRAGAPGSRGDAGTILPVTRGSPQRGRREPDPGAPGAPHLGRRAQQRGRGACVRGSRSGGL